MWFPFRSARPTPAPPRRVTLSVEPLEGRAVMSGSDCEASEPEDPAPPPAAEEVVVAPDPSPGDSDNPPPAEEPLEAPPLPDPDPDAFEIG
ncbi:MAG: hypothetical protein C0501_01750 [Isosphaera sp.]|nr:hypothetical protein [Isosphaera sp.]